jgi:hypothetical protein
LLESIRLLLVLPWSTNTAEAAQNESGKLSILLHFVDVLNWENRQIKVFSFIWRELRDSSHEPKHHKKQSETCFLLASPRGKRTRRQREFGKSTKKQHKMPININQEIFGCFKNPVSRRMMRIFFSWIEDLMAGRRWGWGKVDYQGESGMGEDWRLKNEDSSRDF